MDRLVIRKININIGGILIGEKQPCFIIAEAGVNHNGRMDIAFKLIDAAKTAGANAVKFQTFKTHTLVSRNAPKANYQLKWTPGEESQFDMLKKLELSHEDHRTLINYCHHKQILFLSTPFDEESADLLESLNVPAFKVGSCEITNTPFLGYLARKGKPILLSTGASTLGEVSQALKIIKKNGAPPVALLHCLSHYPADPSEVNLRAIQTLKKKFSCPVGYSDHTSGTLISAASIALGSKIIEKHITIDRNLPGPDHHASLTPQEFISLVDEIRVIEKAMGNGIKKPAPSEINTAAVGRKSLISACDLQAGQVLTAEMISIKRPGTGIKPALRDSLIGQKLRIDVNAETLLSFDMFEKKRNQR